MDIIYSVGQKRRETIREGEGETKGNGEVDGEMLQRHEMDIAYAWESDGVDERSGERGVDTISTAFLSES